MADYFILIPLLFAAIAVLYRSNCFSKIVRNIGLGYFFILTLVFITVRERISYLYEHPPIPDIFWEKNSNWSETGLVLYLLPTVVIIFTLFFSWIKREKVLGEKLLILLFFAAILVLLIVYAFFFSMTLGYKP
ncbi:hypothetical protein [Halobacillus sp. B23F22_1]|uniref:hypothetical protein n=1 Tax=Halobacillus sp. B23F22_1 TaxID=3459514 RepID=UPI00373E4F53